MKKIERRAAICFLLAMLLVVGIVIFTGRYFVYGRSWVSFAANRHIYNTSGQLSVGRIFDRDGDMLSWVDESGNREYYASEAVRKATLHAVGDAEGKIGTGALTAFADKLSGYNVLTGVYTPLGSGQDLYLTLDARLNYIAYQALNGKNGAVGVYNYETGEVLCMVSAPSYDPLNPPTIVEGDATWDGVYLNHFLSGTFVPGSVFKLVTIHAAIEQLPDLFSRSFTCTGSTVVGGETITCPKVHGEMDIGGALANSCNCVFAQLSAELGADTLTQYADKAGITSSYQVSGIRTAKGSLGLSGASEGSLGWAGVGQYNDLINPCSFMVYMGAIANGGKAAVPKLILKTENALGISLPGGITQKTGALVSESTASTLADLMARNVTETYGASRFPNMDICAKSGTGEVGGGNSPHAWFAGFLRNEDAPYAFVVLVENGGGGSDVAGTVASKVLDALVNGY
ncbi:MAG: penicillin-binding protein [Oscillospiraceae bacterium]|nr:penicillin-binding protein [Oscillospiraceae bacterium]